MLDVCDTLALAIEHTPEEEEDQVLLTPCLRHSEVPPGHYESHKSSSDGQPGKEN